MTALHRNGTGWGDHDIGQASQWNFNKTIQTTLEDLEIDANFAWLIFSLLIAMFWFTYITHYSSRVIGQILTRLLNRFVIGSGYLRIGSLTFDVLAGKIMFRDIVYTSEDFSVRIQDGWLVFRWWRSYVPKDITEDLSHSDTRLSLMLNGLELHIYNRSNLYNELEELFGLESLIMPNDGSGSPGNSPVNKTSSKASTSSKLTEDESDGWGARVLGRSWRDLIPVIKVEICCGRAVFGNRLVPTTLCLSMEEGYMVYSTKPAMSKLDHFVHVVTCRAENFKVTLAPSLKYTGLNDEPPRLMGEGFVVLSSNTIDFYYYMDEPGVVPEVPLMVELANGDVVECHAPVWGLDIRCGKGTDFSYGPWADRKREQLFKFFYPPNFQPMKITSPPRPGEKRTVQSFDIRFSTLSEATVDILFTKCKETNAVHMTIGAGSYLEITIPWTVKPDGCATKISGQLLHVDASTSLQYRNLMEAETLKFSVLMQYPVAWNSHQSWNLSLTGTKATLHLIYEHRYFFQDLINDWSSRNPADLLHHIPYTWFLKFCLKEFELVTIANQYNWVDCSSQRQENAYAAFSGDFLELAFALPFNDFLPSTMELKFNIQGESLDMNVQLPETSTSRPVLLALAAHARPANRSAELLGNETPIDCDKERWRNLVKRSEGWVQCWTVPVISLGIQYTYHPMTPPGPSPQANVPTPEREELLLTPVRFPVPTTASLQVPIRTGRSSTLEFDPTTLKADQVNVEIELGPSELFVYGTVLRTFLNLKENIFGEDQRMADMDPSAAMLDMERSGKNESLNRSIDPIPDTSASMEESVVDVRIGRPLHVNVSLTMHDIKAHLMKHCSKDDPPCPTVFLEKLTFEMHKTFLETKLQLLVSPAVLYSTDTILRPTESCHLQQGFLVLSALQVRGHAMFSPTGRAIDEDTVEYGWLIEATLGQLTGRMTMPQLQHVTAGLEVFLRLALDEENQMIRPPKSQTQCHHGTSQPVCPFSTTPNQSTIHLPTTLGTLCPSSEEIKYRMTRLSIDLIDFALVESGTAVTVQIYPLRLATCNLHTRRAHAGVSILIPKVHLRQFLNTSRGPTLGTSFTALDATDRYKSEAVKMSSSNSTWNRTQASGHSRSSVEELYMGREKPHSPVGSHRIDFESAAPIISGHTFQEWLEVGLVEIGPIYVDVGSSADHCRVDLPTLQSTFLRLHDSRTRRLWFLWDNLVNLDDVGGSAEHGGQSSCNTGKCGCRGGCAFFGRNFNGVGFFNCHEEDLLGNSDHLVALANPLLCRGTDPVFSQSILRPDAFLIDFHPPTRAEGHSPPMAATSKERPQSDVSNTSTMKNVSGILILPELALHSNYVNVNSEDIGEDDEEADHLSTSKIQSGSRMSFHELENQSIQQNGSRQRELGTANSTPSVLMTSPGTKRKIFSGKRMSGQNSMPALADHVTADYRTSFTGRKRSTVSSRASRSESQSELYYSAEEDDEDMADSSPSDELVSFPASLPDEVTNVIIADGTRNNGRSSLASCSSSSARASPSGSSRRSSSSTSRTSDISFNSAVSSADDFSLVDLHLQSARPVVDSPLLLTSYISHLGEAECPNWSQQAPKFPTEIRQSGTSKLRFHLTKSGFSSFRLIDRPLNTPGHQGAGFGFFAPQSKEPTEKASQPWVWDASEDERPLGTTGTKIERCDVSTVLVKVGRPIHIMCCPLSLESAQRFVETLVPTLEHLHPMTLMTRVYGRCISHVESQNPLKKQRMALLEQKAGPALYRDLTVYQLRGSIQIPRVNLCLLQAGIVEQFISLSMLDNPRDLVCVSSAAVCIDALSLHFSQNVRECRWVQAVSRPIEQRQSGGNKSFFASVQKPKSRPGKSLGVPEIVFVEWTQTENEQMMASGTLGKIHLQMRRLNNDTPSLTPGLPPDNVTATVIPTGCSRVLFSCTNDHELSSQSFPIPSDEERYGSVVFECGLQGLNLRAVKRVSNVPESGKGSHSSDPKGSVVTTVEMETIPLANEVPNVEDQPPGSVPSHSSHISFKQRSDKGTPTSTEPQDAHHQQNTGPIRPQAEKDLSSCSLQIQAVWLSFAAPPRTSPAKKSELALLDRNLLSTASPAINAWMNSGDRLAITVMQLIRAAETRSLSVLAGLMAEALDVQQIHLPVKSKYSCLSLMSRTLQEDPSCQLNLVLHRYVLMLKNEWVTLEARLAPSIVPPLSTLKQGVIVLGRQWKSAIYTPFMLTYSLHKNSVQKTPANLNVPINSHFMAIGRDAGRLHLASMRSGPPSAEFGDEEERLLAGHNEMESSWVSSDESSLVLSPADLNESSLPLLGRNSTSQPSSPPRLSVLRRKFAGGTHPSGFGGSYELKTISASSAEEENEDEDATAPLRKTDKKELKEEFDLYNWLARQQRNTIKTDPAKPTATELQPQQPQSQPSDLKQQHPHQQFNLLVDTRAIFVSLFASVGLESKRTLSDVLSLSGSASVLGGIEELRVEIFESEWNQTGSSSRRSKMGKTVGHNSGRGRNASSSHKFSVYIPPEVPAFLCERMSIEIQVNQVSDGGLLGTGGTCCEEDAGGVSGRGPSVETETTAASSSVAAGGGTGFLGQIGLWKPQRTTALNFSISVGYLSQHVNMPLLRLLHQLSSVYGNAKATQVQLREQRPLKRGPDPLRALTVIFDSPESTPSPPIPQRPIHSEPDPSPSIQSESIQFANRSFRPPSFLANRLRSSSRFAKMYDHEDNHMVVPTTLATDTSKLVQDGVDPSPTLASGAAATIGLPSCWRTIYHLLDLYSSMTAASTVNKQHSISEPTNYPTGDAELGLGPTVTSTRPDSRPSNYTTTVVASRSERTRIVVFGIMKVNRVRLLAMLSGLRLESEIVSLHTSLTYKEKVRIGGLPNRSQVQQLQHNFPRMECSLTGHLGRAMIVLLEGVAPSQQTVVKITVGKSQALYSRLSHHGKDKNSGLLSIGAVHVDIPQHPGVLHGMMTRGSKQLSSTLQEFRVPRMASRNTGRNTSTIPDELDLAAGGLAAGGSGIFGTNPNALGPLLQSPPKEIPAPTMEHRSVGGKVEREATTNLLQPLVMQFSIVLQRLSITAALLPSLQAQYQMEQVVSAGITGSKAKFDIDLPRHSLSFTTKLQITENLPPSASIELPQVHVGAEYLQDSVKTEGFVDGVVLCRGNYLSAVAEIGVFEHSLTTDLLNHLVFVQKVFMAEVNDVLNKVSGGDKPVPLWEENPADQQQRDSSAMRMLLYHLIVRLKGIQITATTPTNTAVRLETGLVELQLSNRVQNVFSQSNSQRNAGTFSPPSASSSVQASRPAKLFGRAKVDLNLSLGQLIRNPLFEEAEAEFQQVAFFKTRISLRNAFQDELTPNEPGGVDPAADKEVVLITLTRPLIYLQPVAVDKAILVWLNYKNAYEYWTEQRGGWIKDASLVADKLDKLDKLGQLTSQLGVGAPSLGTLFLQLTVDDMGICMPLNTAPASLWAGNGAGRSETNRQGHSSEPEICSAVVVTLENSSISACSSGSLVSKGKFTGLCLRFADDFETGLDDWKPDMDDPAIMNLCVVSEGTYEVCSRTVTPAQHQHGENAKWILHVGWQMEGVDTHFDTSIGRQFSALGHTLTGLTGSEEEEEEGEFGEDYDGDGTDGDERSSPAASPCDEIGEVSAGRASSDEDETSAADPQDMNEAVELRRRRGRMERAVTISETAATIPRGGRHRSRLIEKEMSEQARIIQDLKLLGASSATVEQEMRRLQELEALASKDFRRVMLQRLKRQSVKASSIITDHPMTSTSLSSVSANAASQRPPSLHHTQSQRAPPQNHSNHQRSRSVVVPPVVLDLETSGHGSTDDFLLRDAQRFLLPPIEGSPPMSCLPTPTSDAHRSGAAGGRRPRTPTISMAGGGTLLLDQDRDRSGATSSAENPSGVGSGTRNSSEPSVDLELDFKVFINSGKCVLHTRDTRNDEVLRRMKKERSFSSTVLDTAANPHQPSPAPARKPGRPDMRHNASTSRLRVLANNTAQMAVDLTIFHIPGLDIKVYYESKTVHEETLHIPTPNNISASPISLATNKGKMSNKKGSLFAWMTLHSIPEETIISPHILEFLEQALEPIPITAPESKPTSTSTTENSGLFIFDGPTSTGSPGSSTTASFPVDVVVYCHVQPSTFRFSCLPVSRVECLLRLPSLHLVFSSKRSENQALTGGGLSVTGCLSDFSLYIFHPYGGGKKTGGTSSRREANDTESERKDSLSVNVEFVKFNLSRSRKVNFSPRTAGEAGNRESRNGRDSASDPAKAVVRFSTLIDIGSASFKYDMRRLPEILAFPKAWYRRAIVRHLFLGDLSKTDSSAPDLLPPASRDLWAELQPDQSGLSPASAWETLVVFAVNFTKLNVHMNMGNVMGNVSWLTKDLKAEGRLSIGSTGHKNMHIGIGLEGSGLDAKGGIVGGTIELSGINTSLSIREDPGTEPDHRTSIKLQVLECRLDYMGTSVLMGRVSVLAVDLRDEWRIGNLIKNPDKVHARRTSIASSPTKRPAMIFIHGDLGWDQLQLMISKSTTADLIKMYLKLDEFFQQQFRSSRRIFSTLSATGGGHSSIRRKGVGKSVPAKAAGSAEPAGPTIEAQHHRHWQSVLKRVAGLEIATLPTPLPMTGTILGGTMELHGGHISLACFHGVNFKSKSWALFSLKDPCVSFATEAQEIPGDSDPKNIHVVQNLSFSLGLTGPGAHTPVGIGYRVIEQQQQQNSPASMATVCRISRTQLFPPQFKTIQDWFLYAFANSRLDAMERFPSLERERERSSSGAAHVSVKIPDYHHAAEIIFAFPSLQLHLKSEHLQTGTVPSLTEDKPSVDCSFITDFEDHIFVTVDAEAFFFLHDLISSYVREKERVILASAASNQRTQSPELQKATMGSTTASSNLAEPSSSQGSPGINNSPLSLQLTNEDEKKRRILEQIDWRSYECKTWHLEPTVRLLSWAGKRIEPYGVEYILNKLGFSQARTTIPKWVQRGAMDPLDKILSLVLSRTIAAQRAKVSQTASSTSPGGVIIGGGVGSGGVNSSHTVNTTRPSTK